MYEDSFLDIICYSSVEGSVTAFDDVDKIGHEIIFIGGEGIRP